jgi:CRISPR type III-B/RAMP module-associated protein Cmr3
MGGSGRGPWAAQLKPEQLKRLGGDNQELDGLAFKGPLICRNGNPLFPAPASLLGRPDSNGIPEKIFRLIPAATGCSCDLGPDIHLPAPSEADETAGCKLLEGLWLDTPGLAAVLAGTVPAKNHIIPADTLWQNEPRVGIAIDDQTGMVERSALYSIQYIRPAEGVDLAMELNGPLTDFPDEALVPLGGEARYCRLYLNHKKELQLPACPLGPEDRRYCAHVLTPLEPEQAIRPGSSFVDLPGRVVCCCLPRPQRWGGWDGIRRRPLAMNPCIAPGSVIFMEVDTSQEIETARKRHGTTVGSRKSWGFGLVVMGRW